MSDAAIRSLPQRETFLLERGDGNLIRTVGKESAIPGWAAERKSKLTRGPTSIGARASMMLVTLPNYLPAPTPRECGTHDCDERIGGQGTFGRTLPRWYICAASISNHGTAVDVTNWRNWGGRVELHPRAI